MRPPTEPKLLAPALLAKIPNAGRWEHGCPGNVVTITIQARAPAELLLDTVNSCGLGTFHFVGATKPGSFVLDTSSKLPFGVLAQLAAHPLVDTIELQCPPRIYLD